MTPHIPEEISNLRLIGAFKGLAVDVMDCIVESDANAIYVVDDDMTKSSRLASSQEVEAGGFTAHNPERKRLHLLSIDNKLMSNVAGGIADCALFSKEIFSLLEFKTNAEGHSQASIDETYEGAIRQIRNTLEIFTERLRHVGIDFTTRIDVTPHIVVSPKFPRSNAMEQNYMVEFFDTTGVELSFEDSQVF